jgi:DNA-binding response OmpR family regulator
MSVNFGSDPTVHKDKESSGATLLLADDEALLREILADVLRREGYYVLEAGTTESAVEVAQRRGNELDLLISDVHLPVVGGFQLLHTLRTTNPTLNAIFISGDSREAVCGRVNLPHGTLLLEKPFEARVLLSSIRNTLP